MITHVHHKISRWIDTAVLADLIISSVKTANIAVTEENCRKVWLDALGGIPEIVEKAVEKEIREYNQQEEVKAA